MELNDNENQAVYEAVTPHLEALRGFDFAGASDADIYEFCAWLYAEICERHKTIFGEEDIPF